MNQDTLIEKNISNLVEYQFPEFYRTDGPTFVAFVKAYYKWLESEYYHASKFEKGKVSVKVKSKTVTALTKIDSVSFTDHFVDGDQIAIYDEDGDCILYTIDTVDSSTQLTLKTECDFTNSSAEFGAVSVDGNALYHARRLFEYDDIDSTAEEFIVYFKEKYLKNIQFETLTNKRELVKHALDIYRSKGTPRSVDLLFRMVFGVGADFYYPSSDLFKTSDGKWYVPQYLELSLNNKTDAFINKQIIGSVSGATGFAESLIRRTIKGKLLDVLYISSISGNFQTGETINTADKVVNDDECPRIIGSMTELEVDTSGTSEFYKVGDIVDVYSDLGEQGKARVTSTSDITGVVDFTLINSGYAYTTNAQVLVSEKVLALSNVVSTNSIFYFDTFENIYQPLANIAYGSGNGTFIEGDTLETYYPNNSIKGTGTILSVAVTNSTAGTLLVGLNSGNLNSSPIRKAGNTITANITTYTDKTASANIMAYSSNLVLTVSNVSGTFKLGENVYQLTSNGTAKVNNFIGSIGANGTLNISNTQQVFMAGNIYGLTSNASAYINYISMNMGVKDIINDFYSYSGNRIYGGVNNSSANVFGISSGSGASFALSNTFLFTETVTLFTDYLAPYASVALNAFSYGFPGNPAANSGTIIINSLQQQTYTLGRPTKLVNVNRGTDYTIAPFVLVYEPVTYRYRLPEKIILEVSNTGFFVGESVYQSAVNSYGIVAETNSTHLIVENLRFANTKQFVVTSNTTTKIIGESSAAQANITNIYIDYNILTKDFMGLNLDITTKSQTSNGAVTGLKVVDSGFGFSNGEQVKFKLEGLSEGTAFSVLKNNGFSEGRYKKIGGFTSDAKKIYDGYYYQYYSYEVRSSVMLEKYEDMLKNLLHVTGTKYFGAFVKQTQATFINSPETTIITVS